MPSCHLRKCAVLGQAIARLSGAILLLQSAASLAFSQFHRVRIACGARAEHPSNANSDEQHRRNEDEVRRRHIGEIHRCLLANWLDVFPLVSPVEPANADINLTLAMALVVIVIVEWYSVHVLGWRKFFYRYTHPFDAPILMRVVFVPINVITEIAKPLSLALRLFGNIFGGVVVVYLLTLAFRYFATLGGPVSAVSVLPVVVLAGWKVFDVFVIGTIQAFIFMLLTIIYFGMAREGLHEEQHSGAPAHA